MAQEGQLGRAFAPVSQPSAAGLHRTGRRAGSSPVMASVESEAEAAALVEEAEGRSVKSVLRRLGLAMGGGAPGR